MAHGGVRLDTRENRLNDPHVRRLMDLVRDLRSRGLDVPNVDPNDGGVNAQVLILLETPGPKAVASRFVSRDAHLAIAATAIAPEQRGRWLERIAAESTRRDDLRPTLSGKLESVPGARMASASTGSSFTTARSRA